MSVKIPEVNMQQCTDQLSEQGSSGRYQSCN